ncbi:hypothetical protein [Deinococcus detaillensis]|nr:hypothetical protein [Deinococcus detaillensis]
MKKWIELALTVAYSLAFVGANAPAMSSLQAVPFPAGCACTLAISQRG